MKKLEEREAELGEEVAEYRELYADVCQELEDVRQRARSIMSQQD